MPSREQRTCDRCCQPFDVRDAVRVERVDGERRLLHKVDCRPDTGLVVARPTVRPLLIGTAP